MIPDVDYYGTVKDVRDGNFYRVARLKDNKCWMADNLNLGSTIAINKTMQLTSDTTDIPNGNFELVRVPLGFKYDGTSEKTKANTNSTYIDEVYKGYYSWYTATAGYGTYDVNTKIDVEHSICPKNWRLPSNKDIMEDLISAYGTGSTGAQALLAIPVPHFQFGGIYWNNGANRVDSQEEFGRYWLSTAIDAQNSLALTFSLGGFNSGNPVPKYSGRLVRCIARNEE